MKCPNCEGKLYVIDTRSDLGVTYRRKRCGDCERTYVTVEKIDISGEGEAALLYQKKLELDKSTLKKMKNKGLIN